MRRVLVVDDNRVVRRLLELVLDEAGLEPVPAESGETALARALEDPMDVAIVDQEMPGMKGADLVRALRLSGDPRLAAMPVIGVSAHAEAEAELRAAGACEFVRKPLAEEEILGAVLLALSRARRASWEGPSPAAA